MLVRRVLSGAVRDGSVEENALLTGRLALDSECYGLTRLVGNFDRVTAMESPGGERVIHLSLSLGAICENVHAHRMVDFANH